MLYKSPTLPVCRQTGMSLDLDLDVDVDVGLELNFEIEIDMCMGGKWKLTDPLERLAC